jgi:hypothetical protein
MQILSSAIPLGENIATSIENPCLLNSCSLTFKQTSFSHPSTALLIYCGWVAEHKLHFQGIALWKWVSPQTSSERAAKIFQKQVLIFSLASRVKGVVSSIFMGPKSLFEWLELGCLVLFEVSAICLFVASDLLRMPGCREIRRLSVSIPVG